MNTVGLIALSIIVVILQILERESIAFQAFALIWLSVLAIALYYNPESLLWNLFWSLAVAEVMCFLFDYGDPK